MRKIPNANNHIFKTPGIPWQSGLTTQQKFDAMMALADNIYSASQTTGGDGGVTSDYPPTTLATADELVEGMYASGSPFNDLQRVVVVSTSNNVLAKQVYFKNYAFPFTGVRAHQGSDCNMVANLSSSITGYYRARTIGVWMDGVPDEYINDMIKIQSDGPHLWLGGDQGTPDIPTPPTRYKNFYVDFELLEDNTWKMWLDGTLIDSGTGLTTAITAVAVFTNAHPLGYLWYASIYNTTQLSTANEALMTSYIEDVFQIGEWITYAPFIENITTLGLNQWNVANQSLDLYRDTTQGDNLKVIVDHNGSENGTHTYQWAWVDISKTGQTPGGNNGTLDYNFNFVGTDGQDSELIFPDYYAGNSSGNPVVFPKPGNSDVKVFCGITIKDGAGGELLVYTEHHQDNLASFTDILDDAGFQYQYLVGGYDTVAGVIKDYGSANKPVTRSSVVPAQEATGELVFDSTAGQRLVSGAITTFSADDRCAYIVFQLDSVTTDYFLLDVSERFRIRHKTDGTIEIATGAATPWTTADAGLAVDTKYTMVVTLDITGAAGYIEITNDADTTIFSESGSSLGTMTQPYGAVTIGARSDGYGLISGKIWEVAIKDGTVTAGNITDLNARGQSLNKT